MWVGDAVGHRRLRRSDGRRRGTSRHRRRWDWAGGRWRSLDRWRWRGRSAGHGRILHWRHRRWRVRNRRQPDRRRRRGNGRQRLWHRRWRDWRRGSSTGGSTTATGGSGGAAGASGSGGSGSGLGGSAGSGGSGGGAAGCSGGLTSCNGSCANLQSDPNNCGSCGVGCGSNGLGCVAGLCTCTFNTANGTICFQPGQTRGTCWAGTCVLPGYFPGCNTAADCVPGGCTGPGGYCLGTVDVAGQVNCTDNDGEYVICPTSQGCMDRSSGHVGCGAGSPGTTFCDGPSDCGANGDCCGNSICYTRMQAGVVGSGCPSLGPGNQLGVLCDPLNPTATCPAGKSCTPSFSGAQARFGCQ